MATYGSKQYLLFELMFCCIFDTNLLFEIVFFPNVQNNIFYLKEWDLWVASVNKAFQIEDIEHIFGGMF